MLPPFLFVFVMKVISIFW